MHRASFAARLARTVLHRSASTQLQLAPPAFARVIRDSRPLPRCQCFSTTRAAYSAVEQGTSTSPYTIGELDTATYRAVSDSAMDRLTEHLEELIEELEDDGLDVEYSAGVLTLNLGDKGTYVINKQPPNKQIWLSSPTSGPKRYDYDASHGVWFYHRDGTRMRDLLNEELSVALGRTVEVDLDDEVV